MCMWSPLEEFARALSRACVIPGDDVSVGAQRHRGRRMSHSRGHMREWLPRREQVRDVGVPGAVQGERSQAGLPHRAPPGVRHSRGQHRRAVSKREDRIGGRDRARFRQSPLMPGA